MIIEKLYYPLQLPLLRLSCLELGFSLSRNLRQHISFSVRDFERKNSHQSDRCSFERSAKWESNANYTPACTHARGGERTIFTYI